MLQAIAHRHGTLGYGTHSSQAMPLRTVGEFAAGRGDSVIFIEPLQVLDPLAVEIGLVVAGGHRDEEGHHHA